MIDSCAITIDIFGSEEELTAVSEYVINSCQEHDGEFFVECGHGRIWPHYDQSRGVDSVCQRSAYGNKLTIRAESSRRSEDHYVQQLSDQFPNCRIRVGGSLEEGYYEEREVRAGLWRLMEVSIFLDFRELGFAVDWMEIRDGFEVPREVRRAEIYAEIERRQSKEMEEYGLSYSAEEIAKRKEVIEAAINEAEERLRLKSGGV